MNFPCVLILENQSALLNALVRGLQRLGVRDILEATEGEEALALIKAHGGVDIVFCDMSTKGMSGLEFLRRATAAGLIRAAALCRELPPEQGRAVKLMAHRSGLNLLGHIVKPLQEWSLQSLLTQYARRHQSLSEREDLQLELSLEEDLRRALALGEFHPYFQPVTHLLNGSVTSVEVLVRWHHPSKGLLLTDDFLEALVALDLVDELFSQVFEHGLKMLGVLRQKQLPIQMEFNLLACQLEGHHTVEQIQCSLQRYGVQPEDVTFELAENEVQSASEAVFDRLNGLRKLGCRLSIDGFGGDTLTLDSLSQAPFGQLKLSKNLIASLNDARSAKVVAAVLSLAIPLDLLICAEGVSKHTQHRELVKMGCVLAQGTCYAAPLSGYMLIEWLERHSRREKSFSVLQ